MSKDYWERVRESLKTFCKATDEVICVAVFNKPNSDCQLCGHKPITYNHVLMNFRTRNTIIAGSKCVVAYRKIMERLGKDNKIFYLDKYRKRADRINEKNHDTVKIIPFPSDLNRLDNLLYNPEKLDSNQLTYIMNYVGLFKSERANAMFQKALDIWIEKGYYNQDFLESDYTDIKEWAKDRADEELEDYRNDTFLLFPDEEEELLSLDELSFEEAGFDEVDWDAHDFE